MAKKINYFILLFFISPFIGLSQNVIASDAYIQSCYNRHECYSIGNSALIFLDQRTNEFIIQVDFNKFKIGNDTLDEWLVNLSESNLVFRGQLKPHNDLLLSIPVFKTISVKGTINFNGYDKPYNLDLIFLGNAREGLQMMSSPSNFTDVTKASLQIAFNPKDFKIDSRNHHYKKTITISISRGYINNLTPETAPLLKYK